MRLFLVKIAVIIIFSSIASTAYSLPTQEICISQAVPLGWVVTRAKHDMSRCTTPRPPLPGQANAYTITNISNLPLNSEVHICSTLSGQTIPPGWSSISRHADDGSCDCPYGTGPGGCDPSYYQNNRFLIRHTACLSPPSPGSCPVAPPAATGTISASSSSVIVPYGQSTATVNISWTAQNTNSVCVWQNAPGAAPSLWACTGSSASQAWPYIVAGSSAKFTLSTSSSSPNPVLATTTVMGVAGAQPTMTFLPRYNLVQTTASSGNVLIPATHSPAQGIFAFSWNTPGYTRVDLQGQTNGGAWQTPFEITVSGSTTQVVPLATTYTYRLVPHGSTSPVLATLTVAGVSAPAPTFSINPAHVIVPLGSTQGTFTFTWSAPGYEYLTVTGQTNGGAWSAPFSIQPTGTSTQPIPVGTIYTYRFHPPEDTSIIIGTLTVRSSY